MDGTYMHLLFASSSDRCSGSSGRQGFDKQICESGMVQYIIQPGDWEDGISVLGLGLGQHLKCVTSGVFEPFTSLISAASKT